MWKPEDTATYKAEVNLPHKLLKLNSSDEKQAYSDVSNWLLQKNNNHKYLLIHCS